MYRITLICDFVPIIYSSTDKFHSGKYIAENQKLRSCGKILSLYSLLKLRESLVACFSLPADVSINIFLQQDFMT